MNAILREEIILEPIIKEHGNITEDWIEEMEEYPFEYIKEKQTYYDSEKKYIKLDLIFRRKSDNKFFKVQYAEWGHGDKDMKDQIAEEVFPYTKTVTKYK